VSSAEDYGMPVHPVCDLFPLMDKAALAGLAADIRANGLLHPIAVHEGQLVDGRNRLLACREAGVEPRFAEWSQIYQGPMPLARWIWSVNGERRHLTLDQITAAQVAIKAWEEQEAARQRQVEAGRQQAERGKEGGRGRRKPLGSNSAQGVSAAPGGPARPPHRRAKPEASGRVRERLAKEIGTTVHKVRQALVVQNADPELLKQVAQGTLALHEAARRVKAAPAPEAPAPSAELPPAPAAAPDGPSKRRQMIENAAKRRMIDGLSHIQGACRGLSRLDLSAVSNACTAEETRTWAAIARNAARDLRAVASKLLAAIGEKE
jgi:hypothetical protein